MREQHQKNRQQEQTKAKPVHQPAGKQSDRRKAPQGRAQNVRRRSDQQYPALPTMQGNSQKAEQQVNINETEPGGQAARCIQSGRKCEE